MSTRIKIPAGWEKCRTGIKGARKWRNLRTGYWVTDRTGDPIIHAGIHNEPVKYERRLFSVQEVFESIEAVTSDFVIKTGTVANFHGPN